MLPLPVPDDGVRVMKLALVAAVHAHPLAAVTGSVPVTPTAVTLVGTVPSAMPHAEDEADGAVSDFEHAIAVRATAADIRNASDKRGENFISRVF
jgi:hypothetical protein